MKKITLLLCFATSLSVFGQVTIEKNRLVKDGTKYHFSKYESVFENPEARSSFKKAKTNSTVGQVFGFTGGLIAGFGLGQLIAGPQKQVTINPYTGTTTTTKVGKAKGWGLVGIGAVVIGAGIPFALSSEKHAKKALELENGETTAFKPHFKLESAGNGIALSYNF